MINKSAVFHQTLSNYAFAVDEKSLKIRIRTARDNLSKVLLYYGDTAFRGNPVDFTKVEMKIFAQDKYFDYYEALIKDCYKRTVYYFKLVNDEETCLYYADQFYDEASTMRNDLYKFPYNRKEDIASPPEWLKDAIVYNIFPDSFTEEPLDLPVVIEHNQDLVRNRLGGKLKNVLNRLDYVRAMGFNTIYLNPIFTAGEYHKYDVISYYEIDPLFGTNEEFKVLVKTIHQKGMKIIIDGVFNHSGSSFFAFKDILEKQEDSIYKDWYYELKFPVVYPKNMNDVPNYECFGYERKMPKLNTSNPEVIEYFMDVCRYWIAEYDIDGWRLDVADEVNSEFWREFRKVTKATKPDCVLIGEVWQKAAYYLDGSMFDSVMNYDFIKYAKEFFISRSVDAYGFDGLVSDMRVRYRESFVYSQLNLLDSHDVPRFLSVADNNLSVYNLAVIFLFTAVGVPSVFYGDEQGLTGVGELDYRQNMRFSGDESLIDLFRKLTSIRSENRVVRTGGYKTLEAKEQSGLYVYSRFDETDEIVIALNNSPDSVELEVELDAYNILLEGSFNNSYLEPYGYLILKKKE